MVIRAYNATVGETDGNIIAAIITTHTPRNQPARPRLVHGPLSMTRISSTVHHQPTAARPKSKPLKTSRCRGATTKRYGNPGRLSRREHGLPLVLDPEGAYARARRLGDRQVRSNRVEHALETDRLARLDTERDDVLDLEVDCIPDAHGVTDSVVLHVDGDSLDAEHFADQRCEPGHRAAELSREHLHELVGLLVRRALVDEEAELPVPVGHDLRSVGDGCDLQATDVRAFHLTVFDVEDERDAAVVIRRAVVESRVARTDQIAGTRFDVASFQTPSHAGLLRVSADSPTFASAGQPAASRVSSWSRYAWTNGCGLRASSRRGASQRPPCSAAACTSTASGSSRRSPCIRTTSSRSRKELSGGRSRSSNLRTAAALRRLHSRSTRKRPTRARRASSTRSSAALRAHWAPISGRVPQSRPAVSSTRCAAAGAALSDVAPQRDRAGDRRASSPRAGRRRYPRGGRRPRRRRRRARRAAAWPRRCT